MTASSMFASRFCRILNASCGLVSCVFAETHPILCRLFLTYVELCSVQSSLALRFEAAAQSLPQGSIGLHRLFRQTPQGDLCSTHKVNGEPLGPLVLAPFVQCSGTFEVLYPGVERPVAGIGLWSYNRACCHPLCRLLGRRSCRLRQCDTLTSAL